MNEIWVTVTGWTGGDAALEELRGGHRLTTFRLGSTPRRFKEGQWVDLPTVWYTVKCWGELADHVAASVTSGQPLVVHGRLAEESWQRPDGTTASRQYVVATAVGHDLRRGTSRFAKAVKQAA